MSMFFWGKLRELKKIKSKTAIFAMFKASVTIEKKVCMWYHKII